MTVAICAVFRNEAEFLPEWIDYHRRLGVGKFLLFDHMSEDDPGNLLRPYVEAGIVELRLLERPTIDFITWVNHIQPAAYSEGLSSLKQCSWVAFIDIDEYLVLSDHGSIGDFMETVTADCLAVNWQLFGTSKVDRLDRSRTMTSQLVRRAERDFPANQVVKLIVRPGSVVRFTGPHTAVLCAGATAVDGAGRPFNTNVPATLKVCADRIKIHHYWSRDEDYFRTRKLGRYSSLNYSPTSFFGIFGISADSAIDQLNAVEDKSIAMSCGQD